MRTKIRATPTKDQLEAIQTVEGATVLVTELNRRVQSSEMEVDAQKITIKNTQDELEVWRTKYHESDKKNGILDSKLSFFTGVEVLKYLLSAIGTSYGVNLFSSGNFNGIYIMGVTAVLYVVMTIWQKKG